MTLENPESSPAPRRCPRDGAELRPMPGSDHGSSCGTCGGLFLHDTSTHATFEANGMDLEKSRLYDPAPIDCPGCGQRMKGIVINWIALDLCGGCRSVWLDQGELGKVSEYLSADHRRNHPPSPASADDFGVFGGVADSAGVPWHRDPGPDLAEDLMKVLRDVFDGRR